MVSTRTHPSSFSAPSESASKAVTRASGTRTKSSQPGSWSHTPDRLTLAWLLVSAPVVIWDTGYVFGRPHTMPGGWLNKPLYTPYSLYGTIDYVYGRAAYNESDGFTGAQSAMNTVEILGYLGYLYILWKYGEGNEGFGRKTVGGGWGGLACLTGFALAVMTLSKTCLYLLNEAFSGFKHIGHNDAFTLITQYIIPKYIQS